MKHLLFFLMISSAFMLFAQNDEMSQIEYLRDVHFESIDTPGRLYIMWKDPNLLKNKTDSVIFTTIAIDSSSQNINLTFSNASIGKIEHCSYTLTVYNDTINSVLINVNEEQYLNQLIEQAKEQFNAPYIDRSGKKDIYIWKSKERDFTPVLTIEKNGKKGIFEITLTEN